MPHRHIDLKSFLCDYVSKKNVLQKYLRIENKHCHIVT